MSLFGCGEIAHDALASAAPKCGVNDFPRGLQGKPKAGVVRPLANALAE